MLTTLAHGVRRRVAKIVRRGLWTMGKPIPGPYRPVDGYCWFSPWPEKPVPRPHDHVVCEGGVPLAGAESALGLIKRIGFGAYRFEADGLYFSTTDNSNPNENRRPYRLVRNPGNAFASYTPVNHRHRRASDAEIEQEVDRALGILPRLDVYEKAAGTTIQGKTVLEVGPGPEYGCTMVMECLGAECHVVDPFVPEWSEDFHPRFYRALAARLKSNPRTVTTAPLERLLAACDFNKAGPVRHRDAVEDLSVPSETFDFVISIAVAEHFYDIAAAFDQLARTTRRGGFGIHVIDLRDHRNFARPLEYLLQNEATFLQEFVQRHAECGNRHREFEFLQVFENAGFQVLASNPPLRVDENYLHEFLPRLRSAGHERYRDLPVDRLQPAVIDVLLRKK